MRTVLVLLSFLLLALSLPSAAAAPDAVGCSPGFGGGSVCWVDAGRCDATVFVDATRSQPVNAESRCDLWP